MIIFVNIVTNCSHWASCENMAFLVEEQVVQDVNPGGGKPSLYSSPSLPPGVLGFRREVFCRWRLLLHPSASMTSTRSEEDGAAVLEVCWLESQAGWASADGYVSVFRALNTHLESDQNQQKNTRELKNKTLTREETSCEFRHWLESCIGVQDKNNCLGCN